MANEEGNERLRALYVGSYPAIQELAPRSEGFSDPLLVRLPRLYFGQRIRLMVVGQETHGWDCPAANADPANAIDHLLTMFETFENGRRYFASPFWRASHSLQSALNPGGDKCAFAWSNIGRVDRHKGSCNDVNASPFFLDMLCKEVEIIKPDFLVFWTGPRYDSLLDSAWPSLTRSTVDGHKQQALALLAHQSMPPLSFRTYHPNYLSRSKLLQTTLQTLASLALA